MKKLESIEESKVYCDECIFLENRPTLAETSYNSGKYEQTGTRFYCRKKEKWYTIGTTIEQMGFNKCLYGIKKGL